MESNLRGENRKHKLKYLGSSWAWWYSRLISAPWSQSHKDLYDLEASMVNLESFVTARAK